MKILDLFIYHYVIIYVLYAIVLQIVMNINVILTNISSVYERISVIEIITNLVLKNCPNSLIFIHENFVNQVKIDAIPYTNTIIIRIARLRSTTRQQN